MDPPRIQWKTLDELETSLREFQQLYTTATEPASRRELRGKVIKTKDRARFASRNPKVSPEKRAAKEEMVKWMLVWLDDPSMFADWVTLRREQLRGECLHPQPAPGSPCDPDEESPS